MVIAMRKTLNILGEIDVDVKVERNHFGFRLEDLFLMGARKNPKRAFLFVSKLLGKHIPINPKVGILTGKLLGLIIGEKLGNIQDENYDIVAEALKDDSKVDEAMNFCSSNNIYMKKPTLFVGFAETATALGNSVFSQFKGENVHYIHTTRDELEECSSAFDFEEEHSHATSHFCYPLKNNFLGDFQRLVLVDDEITTGKTALNLIRSINKNYPIREYIVATILDWRNDEHVLEYEKIQKELGIKITVVSLLKGQASCESSSIARGVEDYIYNEESQKNICEEFYEDGTLKDTVKLNETNKVDMVVRNHLFKAEGICNFTRILSNNYKKSYNYLKFSGRFGNGDLELNEQQDVTKNLVEKLKPLEKNTLVLGTEEFMYMPMYMATFIDNAKYQSTTRSPVYVGNYDDYAIKYAIKFKNPFDKDVANYVYNVGPNMYSQVVFVLKSSLFKIESSKIINLLNCV